MKKILLTSLLLCLVACGSQPASDDITEVQHSSENASSKNNGNSDSVVAENSVADSVSEVQTVSQVSEVSDWLLKDADISFVSTKIDKKSNHIEEIGEFTQYSGLFNKLGELLLKIDLSSVKTDIVIRDDRLRDWLFNVDEFTTAVVTTTLDADTINELKVGETMQLTQPFVLEMHGHTVDLVADLTITRESDTLMLVETNTPIKLDVKKFDMSEGIQRLTDIMGLSGIDNVVPVTFKGKFVRPL